MSTPRVRVEPTVDRMAPAYRRSRRTWRDDLDMPELAARVRRRSGRLARGTRLGLPGGRLLAQALVAAALFAALAGAARLPDPLGPAVRRLVSSALAGDLTLEEAAAWLRERGWADRVAQLVAGVLRADQPGDSGGSSPVPGEPELAWPVQGTVTGPFAWRTGAGGAAVFHEGVDIAAAEGAPVTAAAPGVVAHVGRDDVLGQYVEIDHGGGWVTRYGQLGAVDVSPGQTVARGEAIGRVGRSAETGGFHLHFEVRVDGVAVDPLPKLRQAQAGS